MRRTIALLAVVFCLFQTAQADELILPGDSIEYHNTMQIHEFMVNANQLEMAAYLATVIQYQRYYWMDRKDFFNDDREEEGFTYLSGKVYIREDLVNRNTKLDILNATNFGPLMAYMNVVIHEMYHLKDFQTSPLSSENETYHRSFLAYRDILVNYLLKNYELHDSLGSPDKKLWLDRVRSYASQIHMETGTYSLDKYGEVPTIPRPLTHDGCVRAALTREEFGDYALHMSSLMNDTMSYQENMARFDRWARYALPVYGNPRCMAKDETIAPMPTGLPVGYNGPRQRQRIFEVERIEDENYLHVVKTNPETIAGNIDITVDREDPTQDQSILPRTMLRIGNVWQWYAEGDVYFAHSEQRFLVVVSERGENTLPANLSLRFTRKFKDADGNWREGFIGSRELTAQEQIRYGYHPVTEKIEFAQFDKRAPVLPTSFGEQAYGLKIQAKKGDYLRITSPQTDYRRISIHRVRPNNSSEPYRKMDQVAILWDWYVSVDHSFDADGTYIILSTRQQNLETNHAFQLSLQLTRNGRTGPASVVYTPLAEAEYRELGMHTPAEKNLNITIDPSVDAMGLGVSWGTFRPFALVDLNVHQWDWLHFRSLPVFGRTATTHIVREKPDRTLEIVQTFYNWYQTGEYTIRDGSRYFLAVVRDEVWGDVETGSVDIDHYRGTRRGPAEVQYRRLTPREVSVYGFYPRARVQFETAAITPAHPKGFFYTQQRYQLYRFSIPGRLRLRLNKGATGLGERRFILSKVDDARWAAGQPALEDKLRTFSWYREAELDLVAGTYVLTVEAELTKDAAGNEVTGQVPWEMVTTTLDFDPTSIRIETLTVGQMNDARLKLINP